MLVAALTRSVTLLDYLVLVIYLGVMLVIGGYFSKQQHTSKDFFLAGRSMGWFPVGLSIMATLFSALSYTGFPGESYFEGFKVLIQPLAVLLIVPILWYLVLPIYRRLEFYSVYEYLELRFNLPVRITSSVLFVVWRLLWMGGVIYAPCKVIVVATGLDNMLVPLLILMGAVTTAYTFVGGMKAVIWTDVIQAFVMIGGVLCIIVGVNYHVDGGASRVWQLATNMSRTAWFQFQPSAGKSIWDESWIFWGIAPHYFFSMLSFYVADQITAQRFLTTRGLRDSRRSFLLNFVTLSMMSVTLAYVGISLMAFYNEHPQSMRPYWVATITQDPATKKERTRPDGSPWLTGAAQFDGELEAVLAAGALADPNTGRPIAARNDITDLDTGELRIDRLAQRDPATGEFRVLRARDELMPHFLINYLPQGVAGLIFAALLAASMSSMDSGLNSIATLAVSDYYRRLGWAKPLVAKLRGKRLDALNEGDELWLGRWLVLAIGVLATLFSLWVSTLESIFKIMIELCNTFGAPLLALFLLGMLTRRTTAAAAFAALGLGTLLTVWVVFGKRWHVWPWETAPNAIWGVTIGTLGTMLIGYVLSFVIGRRKSRDELTGLVAGIGDLGVRPSPPELATDLGDDRWK